MDKSQSDKPSRRRDVHVHQIVFLDGGTLGLRLILKGLGKHAPRHRHIFTTFHKADELFIQLQISQLALHLSLGRPVPAQVTETHADSRSQCVSFPLCGHSLVCSRLFHDLVEQHLRDNPVIALQISHTRSNNSRTLRRHTYLDAVVGGKQTLDV